jgi:hypothetical protein
VKDDKAYVIGYFRAEGRINPDIDNAAKRMISSFTFLPPLQKSFIEDGKIGELIRTSNTIQSADKSASLSDFSAYKNSTYGIRIQYPSNWTTEEEVSEKEIQESLQNYGIYPVVNFWPPSENGSQDSPFGIGIQIERLPFQESTMNEYIQESIDVFKAPNTDLDIIELNTSSSLGGRPAFKYVLSYLENDIKQKYLQIGTIISGKVYYIYFSAPEQKFSQYLPIIEKMIDSVEIVPTDEPPAPSSVNKAVKFLTYENSTLGIKMQYPSNSKLVDDVPNGTGFALPDGVSESLYDILFVEVIPLPYAVSESAYIDKYVPIWVSWAKENLTNFNLTKSRATTLDDSPAQRLEFTYADEDTPAVELRALSIFAVEDNILYHIGYRESDSFSYSDHIPIIQKMIESFEILDAKGIPHIGAF